jgi:hypothetical protein
MQDAVSKAERYRREANKYGDLASPRSSATSIGKSLYATCSWLKMS